MVADMSGSKCPDGIELIGSCKVTWYEEEFEIIIGRLLLPVPVTTEAMELVSMELGLEFMKLRRAVVPLDMLNIAGMAILITTLLICFLLCGNESIESCMEGSPKKLNRSQGVLRTEDDSNGDSDHKLTFEKKTQNNWESIAGKRWKKLVLSYP